MGVPSFAIIIALAFSLFPGAVSADPNQSVQSMTDINNFKNIIIDVRKSRGGNGDVAAGYLTAIEFVKRRGYRGQITILVGNTATTILTNLAGTSITAGSHGITDQITYQSVESLPSGFKPADLYLTLAQPSGERPDEAPIPKDELRLKNGKTVSITQTVLGNTENLSVLQPNGVVKTDGVSLDLSPAGLGKNESGVYYDYVAAELRGKTDEELRNRLLAELDLHQHSFSGSDLKDIIQGNKLKGAEPGLIYGVSMDQTKQQLGAYLRTASAAAAEGKKSYVFITPSQVRPQELPADIQEKVIFVTPKSMPETAEKGVIYIMKTQVLPHSLFTTLMAYSKAPPLIAGDGAMSAAIAIGRPFVMTHVAWNEANIDNLRSRLLAQTTNPNEVKLIKESMELTDGLQRTIELNSPAGRRIFQQASANMPLLSDKLIEAANVAKFMVENPGLLHPDYKNITDPILKLGHLSAIAQQNGPMAEAARAEIRAMSATHGNVVISMLASGALEPSDVDLSAVAKQAKAMITSRNQLLIGHSAIVLGKTKGNSAVPDLTHMLDKNLSVFAHKCVLNALVDIGTPDALSALKTELGSTDLSRSTFATQVLAKSHKPQAIQLLLDVGLTHHNTTISSYASYALATILKEKNSPELKSMITKGFIEATEKNIPEKLKDFLSTSVRGSGVAPGGELGCVGGIIEQLEGHTP